MESAIADHYSALGLTSDATIAQIKSAYKKLVLTCHPDKVRDESQKEAATDRFHKIQTAYDTLVDEDSRGKYDAEVKLQKLRREMFRERGSDRRDRDRDRDMPRTATAQYDFRTPHPGAATFDSRGPPRYEERVPSPEKYDDRYQEESRASSRKYDGYEGSSRRGSARKEDDKERSKYTTKESERSNRSEKKKSRDRETRRDRDGKFSYVEDDEDDDRARYEQAYRRRNEEQLLRERYSDELRRPTLNREESSYSKYTDLSASARDYMERAKVSADPARPTIIRSSSGRGEDLEIRRSGDSARPEAFVRRSSARPKERMPERPASSGRDIPRDRERLRDRDRERKGSLPEIVMPPLPPGVKRSQTMGPDYEYRHLNHIDLPPPPTMKRAESMPINGGSPSTGSRRRDHGGSKLRNETIPDSGYSSPATPPDGTAYAKVPPQPVTTKYYYGGGANGVPVSSPESYEYRPDGRRTVLREPDMPDRRNRSPPRRARSPSPPRRSSAYSYAPESTASSRPSLHHSTTSRPDRQPLYGEIPPKHAYPDVNYQKRYAAEDVRYASGYSSSASRRAAAAGDAYRPSMPRGATFAY